MKKYFLYIYSKYLKIQINKDMQVRKKKEKRVEKIIADLLEKGVEGNFFPGASAAVSWGSGGQRKECFGCAGRINSSFAAEKVTAGTFFDLASLTKALATTLVIYSLINENKVKLTDTLDKFFTLSHLSDKRKLSIELLLSHTSGLLDYIPYFASYEPIPTCENKEKILQSILNEPLVSTPGSTCMYSDFGFILLGFIIEQTTGETLEETFIKYVTKPTRLSRDIFYLPADKHISQGKHFAATEDCPWRKKIVQAEVHDEHCWLMGGVSGHAGLFGRAEGVRKLCEDILDEWLNQGKKYSWSANLQERLQSHKDNTWCLGFDTPSVDGSSGGKYISTASVGHLGFAGTSFWIDPLRELVIVLLTNRVHPHRDNIKIREFRPLFHNAVIKAIDSKN